MSDYFVECERKLAARNAEVQAILDVKEAQKAAALAADQEAKLACVRAILPEILRDLVSFDDAPYGHHPSREDNPDRVFIHVGVGLFVCVRENKVVSDWNGNFQFHVNGLTVVRDPDECLAWVSSTDQDYTDLGLPGCVTIPDIDLAVGLAVRREREDVPHAQAIADKLVAEWAAADAATPAFPEKPALPDLPGLHDLRAMALAMAHDSLRMKGDELDSIARSLWVIASLLNSPKGVA